MMYMVVWKSNFSAYVHNGDILNHISWGNITGYVTHYAHTKIYLFILVCTRDHAKVSDMYVHNAGNAPLLKKNVKVPFMEFKVALHSFEETEKCQPKSMTTSGEPVRKKNFF